MQVETRGELGSLWLTQSSLEQPADAQRTVPGPAAGNALAPGVAGTTEPGTFGVGGTAAAPVSVAWT
jgi:hypothetical protein